MHQKMRLRYFSVSWKNMRYLQLGIYRGFGIWWLLHICPCFSLEFYLAFAKHQLWVHLWPFKKCCIVLVIINIRSGELSFPESSFQIWGEGRLEADIKLQFVWLKIRTFLLPCFSFLWSANCLLPISIAMLLFPLIWFKRGCSCLGSPIWTSWHPPATAGILGVIGTRASHSSWRSYCRTCHSVVHTFSVVKAGRKVPRGVTSYPQVEARMCCIRWDQYRCSCSFFICWVGFCKSCPIFIFFR